MNAAARALAQGSFVNVSGQAFSLSRQTLGIILLVMTVLASALSVVYVKNLDRELFSDLQTLQQARDDLNVQSGQLLLEQNTWATPTRIQSMAVQQGMIEPAAKDVSVAAVVLSDQNAETTLDG